MLPWQDETNHNTASTYCRMLLCNATRKGNEEFVEMLLERLDGNRNTTDQDGENCDSGPPIRSILVLVDRENVNPNTLNKNGTTALWIAVQKGHERLVKRLLEQLNVNPAPADKDGRTPVFRGGKEGYEKVVKMVLGSGDIEPNTTDKDGQTSCF